MKNPLAIALGLALGLGAPAGHAEVRFSGFGQVVFGQLREDGSRAPGVPVDRTTGTVSLYDDSWSMDQESKLGVQVDIDVTDRINLVGQAMARSDNDWEPELTWAYANIRVNDALWVKLGRQRTPFYRYSDYLDVGAAYPWIRPPTAMYNQAWSNFDGISVGHDAYMGKWFSQVQVIFGQYEGKPGAKELATESKLEALRGVSWDMEYNEWLSLRGSYFQSKLTIDTVQLNPLLGALRQFGQGAVADGMDFNADKAVFSNVGFKIERNNWLIVGEHAWLDMENSLVANAGRKDWYVSAGHQFGKFMPTVTYGSRESGVNQPLIDSVHPMNPFRGPVTMAAEGLRLDEKYTGVGLRWDIRPRIALKGDWTRLKNNLPGTPDTDLVSAGVVFTF